MSNRSLFEINHDFAYAIERDPEGFLDALQNYLRAAYPEHAERIKRYGLTWYGCRHHSEGWEEHINTEGAK